MEIWVIWMIVGIILVIAEMATFTFYLLWLGIAALLAALTAWIAPDSIWLQVSVGCVSALLLTVLTKPLTRRIRSSKGFKDPVNEMVGKHGVVLEEIPQGGMGIVKIGGDTWSATSSGFVAKGENVIVVNRGSTVLEVQKWEGI